MEKIVNRFFHLNIHNFCIFKYFHITIQLDNFKTMVFTKIINVMVDLPKKVFMATGCTLGSSDQHSMLHRKVKS